MHRSLKILRIFLLAASKLKLEFQAGTILNLRAASFTKGCGLAVVYYRLCLPNLEVFADGKLKLIHKDLLEGIQVVLLIEYQHRLLVID